MTSRAHRLAPQAEIAFFRIAQEALTNVAKHARARKVVIELEQRQESVSMTICDDGVGFGPGISSSPQPGKWGLVSMRQRAEAIGGRLRLATERRLRNDRRCRVKEVGACRSVCS